MPRRTRVRELLIVVAVMAFMMAGVAESIRAVRLRAERERIEALRQSEAAKREVEEIDRVLAPKAADRNVSARRSEELQEVEKNLEELKKKAEGLRRFLPERQGIFPDPERRPLPDDGRVVL